MLVFLSAALLIYGAMHFYALGKAWQALPHSPGLALVLLLVGLVMTSSPLLLWQIAKQNWQSVITIGSWLVYVWMGYLFLFCSVALMYDLGHALATVLGLKWPLGQAPALLGMVVLTLSLLGYGLVAARQVQVEEITITTPKLSPSIGRVRIAQLSDLHLGALLGEDFLERIMVRLRELRPDILVATGDIVDAKGDQIDSLAQRFQAITAPQGAYAIVGNHEYYAGLDHSLAFLRSAGFTVLRDESVATAGIVLVGVDDPGARLSGHAGGWSAEPAGATAMRGKFIVRLQHQPVVDAHADFDLQLSGHVHGGQIFPVGLLTRLVYGVGTGLTQLAGGRWLYVTRGAGTWGPPLRILATPEITLITIESAKE